MREKEKKIEYVCEFYVFLILIRTSDTSYPYFLTRSFSSMFFVRQNKRCLFCLGTKLF